jgi:BTB/POZ domain-containing protein KCTD9
MEMAHPVGPTYKSVALLFPADGTAVRLVSYDIKQRADEDGTTDFYEYLPDLRPWLREAFSERNFTNFYVDSREQRNPDYGGNLIQSNDRSIHGRYCLYYTTSPLLPLNETCRRLVETDPPAGRLFWRGDILLVRYTGELGVGHEYVDTPYAMLAKVADILKSAYVDQRLEKKPGLNMPQTVLPQSVDTYPLSAGETPITLQVGERRFVTTRDTLTERSGFFYALLSGRWDNRQDDGTYFIDADPDVFKHILCYLRRGVFPTFFDKSKGHDHALYLAVLEDAKYFQIPLLVEWIQDKRYLKVIKTLSWVEELEGGRLCKEVTTSDMDVDYHICWESVKVYVCPRGIHVHRGKPEACGKMCQKAKGDEGDEYVEEKVLKTAVVRKQIIFDSKVCLE